MVTRDGGDAGAGKAKTAVGGAGRGAPAAAEMGCRDVEAAAEGGGETTSMDNPEEETRAHPSKLTHGFWLRRYSGLHAPGGTGAGARPADEAAHSAGNSAGRQPCQQQQPRRQRQEPAARQGGKRPRLLSRWTSALMAQGGRVYGGSTAEFPSAAAGQQKQLTCAGQRTLTPERAGASSAPPASQPGPISTAGASPATLAGQARRPRLPKRRPKAASSTLSANEAQPERSGGGGGGAFSCQFCGLRSGDARRSHTTSGSSSCGSSSSSSAAARADSTLELASRKQSANQTGDEGASRASPYWQLARLLGAVAKPPGNRAQQQRRQQVAAADGSKSADEPGSRAASLLAGLIFGAASPRKRRDTLAAPSATTSATVGGQKSWAAAAPELAETSDERISGGGGGGESRSREAADDKIQLAVTGDANEISALANTLASNCARQSQTPAEEGAALADETATKALSAGGDLSNGWPTSGPDNLEQAANGDRSSRARVSQIGNNQQRARECQRVKTYGNLHDCWAPPASATPRSANGDQPSGGGDDDDDDEVRERQNRLFKYANERAEMKKTELRAAAAADYNGAAERERLEKEMGPGSSSMSPASKSKASIALGGGGGWPPAEDAAAKGAGNSGGGRAAQEAPDAAAAPLSSSAAHIERVAAGPSGTASAAEPPLSGRGRLVGLAKAELSALAQQQQRHGASSPRCPLEPARASQTGRPAHELSGSTPDQSQARFVREQQEHQRTRPTVIDGAVETPPPSACSAHQPPTCGAAPRRRASGGCPAAASTAASTAASAVSLLPLIQPVASSSSSFASLSICNLDSVMTTSASASQQQLAGEGEEASAGHRGGSSSPAAPREAACQLGMAVVVTPPAVASFDARRAPVAGWSQSQLQSPPPPPPPLSQPLDASSNSGTREHRVAGPTRRRSIARPLSQPIARQEKSGAGGPDSPAALSPGNRANKTSLEADPAATTATATGLRGNFKKLVKRQQSVDSYRMARDLKQKLKRQQQRERPLGAGARPQRTGSPSSARRPSTSGRQHQSHEAIKTRSVGDELPVGGRKFSMRNLMGAAGQQDAGGRRATGARQKRPIAAGSESEPENNEADGQVQVEICVDPYAQPGSFVLPGERLADAGQSGQNGRSLVSTQIKQLAGRAATGAKSNPTPPNTLSLMPTTAAKGGAGSGCSSSGSFASPASILMGNGFSGCITPTYPTHHLPSPKYVSPAAFMAMQKKHSNASTISSSFGADSLAIANVCAVSAATASNSAAGPNGLKAAGNEQSLLFDGSSSSAGPLAQRQQQLSDTEQGSFGSLSYSRRASRSPVGAGHAFGETLSNDLALGPNAAPAAAAVAADGHQPPGGHGANRLLTAEAAAAAAVASEALAAAEAEASAAAQRRANLAEHIYDNKCGLGEDMKFLASLPELCDITFLVGETREPVCAVKSVLAARSRVFHKILFGNRLKAAAATAAAVAAAEAEQAASAASALEVKGGSPALPPVPDELEGGAANAQKRRDSSPRPSAARAILSGAVSQLTSSKSSLPASRSGSPNQQLQALKSSQQQQQQQQQQQPWSVTSDASGLSQRPASGPGPAVTRTDSSVTGGRSGRVSVISNGRESVSQASQSSQQPLIIGPGQTATLVPGAGKKVKKSKHGINASFGESAQVSSSTGGVGAGGGSSGGQSRLSRMFSNKRPSDPAIRHPSQPGGNALAVGETSLPGGGGIGAVGRAGQNYLDKMSSSQRSTTMIIEEFEPDVFRQLIEYIHTGCVLLQARTLLGLLNAADYYGLEQLRRACLRFVSCCITVDTVCSLLSTAERYIQYKCTKSIVQKVLEFVDTHANEIFKLNAFGLLPEHVVRLILARDGLQADEQVKYTGVYTWCEHYCRSYELTNMSDVMRNFLNLIQFHRIPTNVLLTEIYPMHIVPDEIFLSALAYQADPEAFEAAPAAASRQRRMTLPSSLMSGATSASSDGREDDIGGEGTVGSTGRSKVARNERRLQLLSSRKSTGGQAGPSPSPSAQQAGRSTNKPPAASRKGSFAQASISSVKRLSYRLPIRKRQTTVLAGGETSRPAAGASGQRSRISKQVSLAQGPAAASNGSMQLVSANNAGEKSGGSRDPIQVGRQILEAYLEMKLRQELEEEERQLRIQIELEAAEEIRRKSGDDAGGEACNAEQPDEAQANLSGSRERNSEQSAPSQSGGEDGGQSSASSKRITLSKAPSSAASSTRKSFRDFKNISRRLFIRHSSSKSIQVQHSAATTSGAKCGPIAQASTLVQMSRETSTDSAAGQGRFSSIDKTHEQTPAGGENVAPVAQKAIGGGRRLLKIRRSETVFESTPASGSGGGSTSKLLHQLSANLKRG